MLLLSSALLFYILFKDFQGHFTVKKISGYSFNNSYVRKKEQPILGQYADPFQSASAHEELNEKQVSYPLLSITATHSF